MSAPRTGVLLVNLGTPQAPTPQAVRDYLKPFLSDRRVVDYPRWLWYPILYGVILPLRSRRVAKNYQAVWREQGSPLRIFTQQLADELSQALGGDTPLALGMTYGEPSLAQAVDALTQQGAERLLVLPLFPQYSSSTTAAVYDGLHNVFAQRRFVPSMRLVNHYYDHPLYIQALAHSVRQSWQQHGRGEQLVMSFHGIPERYVRTGDPYQAQCESTAQRLAQALALTPQQWQLTYQSRVGKEPWLGPDTEQTLCELAGRGTKRVDVISPAFATDCLETLDELAIEAAEAFTAAGGEALTYVPALNDAPEHVALLLEVLKAEGQGWLMINPTGTDAVAC